MAFEANLAFVTVMDVSIISRDFTQGATYSYTQGTDTFHALPFALDGVPTDTALLALLNGLNPTIDAAAATFTSTATELVLTQDGAPNYITTFNMSTGAITYGAQVASEVTTFTMPVQTWASMLDYATGSGLTSYINPVATLDSLTISNVTQEGPRKEIRGGKNAIPIVRYGKTMRLEIEDAIFNISALEALADVQVTRNISNEVTDIAIVETFAKNYALIGSTYLVDKATGDRKEAYLYFYNYLPDGIFNINMESEGDIGTMAMAGELFALTDGSSEDGKFFSIVEKT